MKITSQHPHKLTKRLVVGLMVFAVLIAASIFLISTQRNADAHPATAGFNAGKIIDDTVFTNYKSMSATQIQSFLNARVVTCNTNGVQPIPQWVYDYGNKAPFTCLKDYTQNGKKASQIIYDAAQKYRINPQVLLVLLEKEQSLVTDTWPTNNPQYKSAAGYGCPDTAACDSNYYGLVNQLEWAAKMFRAIMDNVPQSQWYTPYVLGNNYIQYNPDKACGGSTVNIQNRATQALYNYTPYQPNKAALDAGTGSAACGAYGNRNFYIFFKNWFGDPVQKPTYTWSVNSAELYSDPARTIKLTDITSVQPGQKIYLQVKAKNSGNQVWYRQFMNLATSGPRDRSSTFRDSTWISSNRLTRMVEAEAQPGAVATFQATLQAPTTKGTYNEPFSLVNEGITWLNDPGMAFKLTVSPVRETILYSDANRTAKIGTDKVTTYPGDKIYATVKIKNNTSSPLAANTRIATTNPNDRISEFRDSTWISDNRISELGKILPIGSSSEFKFTLLAPTKLGTFEESFGMVVDSAGGGWIEDNTSKLSINVIERPADRLQVGDVALKLGDQLRQGPYRLTLQSDGNLVLYNGPKALWASHTVRQGGNRLQLQSDGNLVLYSNSRAVWASHTAKQGGNRLQLQSDGNLVLYSNSRAVWASHTAGR